MTTNITQTRPGGASVQRTYNGQGEQFVKLSEVQNQITTQAARIAAEMVHNHMTGQHQYNQAMQKRSAAIRGSVRQRIQPVVDFAYYHRLKQSGVQLSHEVLRALPTMQRKASEAMASLEEDVIDGQDAKDYIVEQLLEAAAEDPITAAELISAETGDDVPPEVVDDAAEEVADSAVKEEDGHTKESSVRARGVKALCDNLGPLTQEVLVARARTKVSGLRRYQAYQEQLRQAGQLPRQGR